MDAQRGQSIDTPDQMAKWQVAIVDGVLSDQQMPKPARRKHYPGLPHGRLNDEERDEIGMASKQILGQLEIVKYYTKQLSENDRNCLERSLLLLMRACFLVGQQTQYGPALIRWAQEKGNEAADTARKAKRITSEIIEEIYEQYMRAHGSSTKRTANGIAGKIEPKVTTALAAVGKPAIKRDSLARSIRRIRTASPSVQEKPDN